MIFPNIPQVEFHIGRGVVFPLIVSTLPFLAAAILSKMDMRVLSKEHRMYRDGQLAHFIGELDSVIRIVNIPPPIFEVLDRATSSLKDQADLEFPDKELVVADLRVILSALEETPSTIVSLGVKSKLRELIR